jgi:hypothetical protein
MSYLVWREGILMQIRNSHGNKLIGEVLEYIARDRNGEIFDNAFISNAIKSLVLSSKHTAMPLQFYVDEFESPLLEKTKSYYERESSLAISTLDITSFMKKVHKRLEEERMRAKVYCDPSSYDKFMNICIQENVGSHQTRLQEEFNTFLKGDKMEDLELCYMLLVLLPEGLGPVLKAFEKYITEIGRNKVIQLGNAIVKEPKIYVDGVLELISKYSQMVTLAFKKDNLFETSMDKVKQRRLFDTRPLERLLMIPVLIQAPTHLNLFQGTAIRYSKRTQRQE